MDIPNWIQKTISGSLICFFCGSGVIQWGGVWFCLNDNCEKHADIPAERQQGFPGWITSGAALATASDISASPSPSPSQEFEEGGE